MMAFVEALQKWRHYLMDCPITAQTDSKFVERTNMQKATASRLVRWWKVLSEFKVKFEHIEGRRNIVADALSRHPIPEVSSNESVNPPALTPATPTQVNLAIINGKFKFDYSNDKEFGKIWNHFRDEELLVNGNVRVGGLVCVPKKDRFTVLKMCHDEKGHLEGNKLAHRVSTQFYWHCVRKDAKKFTEACASCQANKTDHTKPQGKLHPLPAPKRSWEHVTMDFFFDLPTAEGGYNGVLLVVD
jgi:hypothetical protein